MDNGTPESEYSIECFQNYTAPEVFIQGLAGMVNQSDVETMIRAQKQMLQRFEKTNEMLTNCNALSASRLKQAGAEFKKHTQLLLDMKKDLDYIFKKIRILKVKLSTQYPEAFEAAQKTALANAYREEDEFDSQDGPESQRESGSSSRSKSTETLRPSTSQGLSLNLNDGEIKPTVDAVEESKDHVDSRTQPENSKDKVPPLNEPKEPSKCDEGVAKPKKSVIDKTKRESSGSSSSDNSNTCESSGDCTSDTG